MLKIEPLEFKHAHFLDKRLKELNLNLSEYSFANLYLFRDLHRYELLLSADIFIKGQTRRGEQFLMPTSHPNSWSKETIDFISQQAIYLFPIPFEWLIFLEKYMKNFSFCEADSDYLFHTEKIASYQGTGLNHKKKLVNELFQEHNIESHDFTSEFTQEVLQIIDTWQIESCKEKIETDYCSAVEAVHLFNQLKLKARWHCVDGQPKGVVIGEKLSNSCFTLHFFKASKSIHGLNQYMFQDFAQSLKNDYKFLNYEQDLGLSNLRQAKRSYHPDQLLHKYQVHLA